MYLSCPAARVSLINHNEIKLLFHLRYLQINRIAILRIRRKGINSLIIYLWHAKKVLDYCLPFVCVCLTDILALYWVENVKCIASTIHNFDVIDRPKKGAVAVALAVDGGPACLGLTYSGATGSWGHIIKCQTLFGAALVCRNSVTFGQNAFLFDRPFGHDTPRPTAATAQRQRSLI